MYVLINYVTDTHSNYFKQQKEETMDEKIISFLKKNVTKRMLLNNVYSNTKITQDNTFEVL